jgi:hypothetical protein
MVTKQVSLGAAALAAMTMMISAACGVPGGGRDGSGGSGAKKSTSSGSAGTGAGAVCSAAGEACSTSADCCNSPNAQCLSDDGACHDTCTSSAECNSGCCLQIENKSYGLCGAQTAGATCLPGSVATMSGISCPMNYCSLGMGGYDFSYADGDPPATTPTGMSHATLTPGELCITGNVMALPPNPTPTDYANDWGCGIGLNLDQAPGSMASNAYALSGSGVLVETTGVPVCTTARVLLSVGGVDYCAPLTDGALIPWSEFKTECWTNTGTPLSGAPSVSQLKVELVTSATACSFSNFCLTNILL